MQNIEENVNCGDIDLLIEKNKSVVVEAVQSDLDKFWTIKYIFPDDNYINVPFVKHESLDEVVMMLVLNHITNVECGRTIKMLDIEDFTPASKRVRLEIGVE